MRVFVDETWSLPHVSAIAERINLIYMNAPLCARFSRLRRTGWAAALHSALLQPVSLRAPMKSADSRLIQFTRSIVSDKFSGLVSPRSYPFCHHARMPPQLLTFHPLQQKLFLSVKSGWFDAFVVFPVRPLMCQHRPNYPSEFIGHRRDYAV